MTMTATATDIVKIPGNMVLISEEEYEKLLRAKENDEYRKKLEHSIEQLREGKTISFTLDELKAMEDEDWKPTKKVLDWMERMEKTDE